MLEPEWCGVNPAAGSVQLGLLDRRRSGGTEIVADRKR